MKWDAASGVFGRFNDCEFFAKYLRDAKGPSVPISERCSMIPLTEDHDWIPRLTVHAATFVFVCFSGF